MSQQIIVVPLKCLVISRDITWCSRVWRHNIQDRGVGCLSLSLGPLQLQYSLFPQMKLLTYNFSILKDLCLFRPTPNYNWHNCFPRIFIWVLDEKRRVHKVCVAGPEFLGLFYGSGSLVSMDLALFRGQWLVGLFAGEGEEVLAWTSTVNRFKRFSNHKICIHDLGSDVSLRQLGRLRSQIMQMWPLCIQMYLFF